MRQVEHGKRRTAWTAHSSGCSACRNAPFSEDQTTQAAALCGDGARLWLAYEATRLQILDAHRSTNAD